MVLAHEGAIPAATSPDQNLNFHALANNLRRRSLM